MKYSIAVLFTLIFGFSTNIIAKPSFEWNVGEVIKPTFQMTSLEFIAKCLSKGNFAILKLTWDTIVHTKVPNELADDMVRKAKTSKVDDANGWKKVSNDVCQSNPDIINKNKADVDKLNKCFSKEKQLDGVKKDSLVNALTESFCSAVKVLAIEKLAYETKQG